MQCLRSTIERLTRKTLTVQQFMTIQSLADSIISDDERCVQRGCAFRSVYRRPDRIIRSMKKDGTLPEWVEAVETSFVIHASDTRLALTGVSIEDLFARKSQIETHAMLVLNFDGGEVFRLLNQMVMHGYRAGVSILSDDPYATAMVEYFSSPCQVKELLKPGARSSTLARRIHSFSSYQAGS